MLPIKVTPVAGAHIQKAANWWLANREKAPEAFKEELQRGLALISQQPESGAKATNSNLGDVRAHSSQSHSIFLPYRVKENRVEVLALWHQAPNRTLQPTSGACRFPLICAMTLALLAAER